MFALEAVCLVADHLIQPDCQDLPSIRRSEDLFMSLLVSFWSVKDVMVVNLGYVKHPRNLVPTVLGHRDIVRTN